jgi:endonuclease YncB( thermonuclease family)
MEARNELVNLIEGKCVMIYVYEKDQYERYIGDIYCGGVFIQVKQKILTLCFF